MEVTETRSEGLARELKVVIPAATLEERLTAYLDDMRTKVRLKGFRPGKVPVAHLRRVYGRSAMAEVINEVMTKSVEDAVQERSEVPALRPDVDLDEDAIEGVVDGSADLAFAIKYEVLPAIEVSGLDTVEVERPVTPVEQTELDGELNRLAEANRLYEDADRPAEQGDRLTIDFVGKIDDVAFDGGTAEGIDVEIGADRFIPGFEAQLEGATAGSEREVNVTFPEDYPAAELAGKAAAFAVTVSAVKAPQPVAVDDALAERLGLESLEQLTDSLRKEIEQAYGSASRQKVKRALLDALDERYSFELPEKLVESEFEGVWRQVTADMEKSGESFDDEGEKSEASMRAEFKKIAERRVRLGLLLSEIGTNASIEVTEDEVRRAIETQMRQYPGHEKEVFEVYRKNPQAVAALRAPIFEDKVVDYVLELVKVTEKTVTKDELLAPMDDDYPASLLNKTGSAGETANPDQGQDDDPTADDQAPKAP